MPWKSDLERHRVRRTLFIVRGKLEEALRLSRGGIRTIDDCTTERKHGEPTATNRYR